MVIKQKHYKEIHHNAFSVTSKYDRGRRLAAVKYYLTRLLFVKSLNGLVRYCLTRLSLALSKTDLLDTT